MTSKKGSERFTCSSTCTELINSEPWSLEYRIWEDSNWRINRDLCHYESERERERNRLVKSDWINVEPMSGTQGKSVSMFRNVSKMFNIEKNPVHTNRWETCNRWNNVDRALSLEWPPTCSSFAFFAQTLNTIRFCFEHANQASAHLRNWFRFSEQTFVRFVTFSPPINFAEFHSLWSMIESVNIRLKSSMLNKFVA